MASGDEPLVISLTITLSHSILLSLRFDGDHVAVESLAGTCLPFLPVSHQRSRDGSMTSSWQPLRRPSCPANTSVVILVLYVPLRVVASARRHTASGDTCLRCNPFAAQCLSILHGLTDVVYYPRGRGHVVSRPSLHFSTGFHAHGACHGMPFPVSLAYVSHMALHGTHVQRSGSARLVSCVERYF
jgi:hypothetical protein